MLKDFRKNQTFSRRTAIIGGIQVGLFSALVARLGYLQLFGYEEYSGKSEKNRIRPMVEPAPRGVVFDRNGKPLSDNRQNYRLILYTDNKFDAEKTIAELSQILSLSAKEKEIISGRIKNARKKNIVSLLDNLSWDDVARLESNYHKLSGVSVDNGNLRFYPYPEETAHVLGYVSLPSDKETSGQEQNLFLHPDFRIGKSGIERSFDDYLRGKFGVRYVEVNAYGAPIRTLSKKDSEDGGKINLTIDFDLQKFATDRIKDVSASVVAMDVKTGEILVMASSPSFDPNKFVEGVSHEYWNELINDPKKPLNNKPVSATYPPGSPFKLMTAIAALENGINPKQKVYCDGTHRFGNRIFHCWEKKGHGSVNMSDAIKYSCNTYFWTIAAKVGMDKIADVAKRFGYGEFFDVSLFGVRSGNLPTTAWKQKTYKQVWTGGDTLNAAIGQGFLLASPLQMAVITSRIANGGVPIKPYLVKNRNIHTQFDSLKSSSVAKKPHLNLIHEGMTRVINEDGGTARSKAINIDGFKIAGKTGTSQVISKREDEMSKKEKDSHQNHAIFVAFGPLEDPRYAVSVVVEHAGGGSANAGPIGQDVMREIAKRVTTNNLK